MIYHSPDDRPLAIDLYCGLGGWTEGLIDQGYYVVGFDIEAHEYDDDRYPGHLVVQDVLSLHGSQFKHAAVIVCSPPCQKYSYMAMPWSRAKAMADDIRADETGQKLADLNELFNACFRIQREAAEAAGHHIPMVVENVRGAIPWIGRSRANCGSMHFWGDVPALMPQFKYIKVQNFRFDGSGRSFQTGAVKQGWFNDVPRTPQSLATLTTRSPARKAASARIAKVPFTLSQYIAATFKPTPQRKLELVEDTLI